MDERRYVPDVPGRIYEAMAVKGKKVMGLGTDEEIRRLAGSQTRIVDLSKKTVIPGIIETHAHSYGTAPSVYGPQLGVVVPGIQLEVETQPSAEATAKTIRDTLVNAIQTRKLPEGEWISMAVIDSDKAPAPVASKLMISHQTVTAV